MVRNLAHGLAISDWAPNHGLSADIVYEELLTDTGFAAAVAVAQNDWLLTRLASQSE